jgi:carbon storage regulator
MLVFRRQPGESFWIGDNVEVKVLEIGRNQVKIGVVAPRETGIYRSEISQMNRRAAVADPHDPGLRRAAEVVREAILRRFGQ